LPPITRPFTNSSFITISMAVDIKLHGSSPFLIEKFGHG